LRIAITGGSGQVGLILARHFHARATAGLYVSISFSGTLGSAQSQQGSVEVVVLALSPADERPERLEEAVAGPSSKSGRS
jgi:hypothetical protein